ncbi:MAG: 30S ribosomal protein S20 [Candidatus Babeliales bacterium]
MANTVSAKKQARQNKKRHLKNLARRTSIKTAVKKLLTGAQAGIDAQEGQRLLADAQSKLARAQIKGLMHKNTVRRKVSRLARALQAKNSTSKEAAR